MSQSAQNQVSITVAGNIYGNWTDFSISRALDKLKSVFTLQVTQQFVTSGPLINIMPFQACVMKIGSDVILTGWVDNVEPEYDGKRHTITITGASKTTDLVECMPDIAGGQYKGYTLEQIARAVCAPYGIGVLVQTDASQVFPDATLQRGETDFTFLERLGRLAGVLLTDDANGNLVLTTAGTARAAGRLVEGQNILAARGKLNGEHRFSIYIVKGQTAIGSANASWGGAGGIGGASAAAPAPVQNALRATATDTGVPRYRPHVSLAEAQLDAAGMQRRANWERNFAFGRATSAEITVAGFRQPNGALWATNQLISVTSPKLMIDQDLLIAETTFLLSATSGPTTKLRVGPVEGFTPDPGEVKLHAKRGKKGKTAPNWDGAGVS